jgi:hypothetical protein
MYKNSVPTSQEARYISITKTYWLKLFRKMPTLYCEKHTKHKFAVWAEIFVLKQVIHIVTFRL